ncbi:MAG: hypothetical protein O0X93_02665 [Methanocorpusculum sp.]|nr:hypothetical protein [Methanocorpusculum sp.]MDE2522050.1 hypothetical protein [Methanocorpusculum sp.]MDE2524455.1 hypothetical protein [Methanocorpusculum sp.]
MNCELFTVPERMARKHYAGSLIKEVLPVRISVFSSEIRGQADLF